ncbi:hypothetical protein ASG90_06885 [Nocardioides sp. Soil797]|nr:hypothetical protein ASG90_06885 [Nocardioides sp. Soil797]
MAVFADAAEVDTHVGTLFRQALADPTTGPQLRAAGVVLRVMCHDPDCELVLRLHDPVHVSGHGAAPHPVVSLGLPADLLDGFLRGSYSLVEGMADEEIRVKGPVSRVLRALAVLDTPLPAYGSPDAARHTPPGNTPPRPRTAEQCAAPAKQGSARR